MFQALVLLLFNKAERISFGNIVAETRLGLALMALTSFD
jgi:hypothetical protein